MRIFDISVPISDRLPVYPGDPQIKLTRIADFAQGDALTLSHIKTGTHIGTHVDAPLHFIRGGATIDALDLGILVGTARVVDMSHVERMISTRDLQTANLPTKTERILFKTKNSALWDKPDFQENYVALAADGAQWLVAHSVRLVGIDYLSIEALGAKDFATHKTLLQAGVIIVEGLNLKEIDAGTYQLICLPLKLQGTEGAPARAILIKESE